MYQFTNMLGDPVDVVTQNILETLFSGCSEDDMRFYDHLIHLNERQFENVNREICSHCGSKEWEEGQKQHSGCCVRCGGNNGYHNGTLHNTVKDNFLYTKEHGYFDRKHMHCGLPRHIRSVTCLGYACDFATPDIVDDRYTPLRKQRGALAEAIGEMRFIAYANRQFEVYISSFERFCEDLVRFKDSGGKL